MARIDQDLHSKRWKALAVWIIIFTVAVGYAIHQNRDLIHQNEQEAKTHNREVQLSRQHSCEQTYLTIRKIFIPFVKPKKLRSDKEQKQLDRFLYLTRPSKCKVQTNPDTVKKGTK